MIPSNLFSSLRSCGLIADRGSFQAAKQAAKEAELEMSLQQKQAEWEAAEKARKAKARTVMNGKTLPFP